MRRKRPFRNIDFTKSAVRGAIFFGFTRADADRVEHRSDGAPVAREPALARPRAERRRRCAVAQQGAVVGGGAARSATIGQLAAGASVSSAQSACQASGSPSSTVGGGDRCVCTVRGSTAPCRAELDHAHAGGAEPRRARSRAAPPRSRAPDASPSVDPRPARRHAGRGQRRAAERARPAPRRRASSPSPAAGRGRTCRGAPPASTCSSRDALPQQQPGAEQPRDARRAGR